MKRKGGGRKCRGPGCPARIPNNGRWCPDCHRVLKEQWRAMESVLFPPREPYTPRVVTVGQL